MFHNVLSTAFIFRLINFGALMAFFAYVFKRTMVPSIKKQIQEKKLLLQNLEQQKQGIKYQHSNLDSALEQQHYLGILLNKKIKIWSTHVEHQTKLKQEEMRILQKKMHEKALIQNQVQTFKQLTKSLIPEIIVDMEKKLGEEFSHPEQGQKFIKDIIGSLQESSGV